MGMRRLREERPGLIQSRTLGPGLPAWHAARAMIEVTVQQAAAQMDELLDRATAGEEVVVMRSGQPVARLAPCAPRTTPRIPGRCASKIVLVGDFNAPPPDNMLDAFER